MDSHGAHRTICAEQANQNSDRASILDISLYVLWKCTGSRCFTAGTDVHFEAPVLNHLCDDLSFNRVPLFPALENGFVFKAFGKMRTGKAFLGKMRPELVRSIVLLYC